MVAVGQWTGRETRRLRHALRLTVREFAEDVGVSVRTVSKWESKGTARTPRPELQAALDTMLARATDEQQRRFGTALGERAGSPAPTAEPDRSATTTARAPFLLPLGAAVALPHLSVDLLRRVNRLVDDARGRIEADLVPYLSQCIEACQKQDGDRGPVHALPSTLGVLAAIDVTAREVSGEVRRQLLTLAARSAEFAGWLYRDAGVLDQATYWYDRATEWAQEAHNSAMQGYVLLRKSQLAYDTRDAIRVLTLAEAAAFGPWQLPLSVQAEVAQQLALGLSMSGASVEAVERQLDDAWSRLKRTSSDETDAQLFGSTFTDDTLRLRSAACYHEAGQSVRATELLGQVLASGGLSRRDAAYFTARQAAALAASGEPDAAAETALQSVDVATSAQSQRTLRVLAEVVDALQPWSDRPAVRTLQGAVGL